MRRPAGGVVSVDGWAKGVGVMGSDFDLKFDDLLWKAIYFETNVFFDCDNKFIKFTELCVVLSEYVIIKKTY